jgi:hypothetical protein
MAGSLAKEISDLINSFTSTTQIVSPAKLAEDISNSNIGDAVLAKQYDMQKIVKNENIRLNNKQTSINDAITSKKRMIQLNNNFIERKLQYQKMLIAIIIGLAIYFAMYIIDRFLPIPDAIFFLILIVTFIGIGIYCFNIYLIIINRDLMDFNKLNIAPPFTILSTQAQDASNAQLSNGAMDLLGNLKMSCLGSSCCSTGTIWDVSAQLCINNNDGFTPIIEINFDNFKIITQNNTKTNNTPYLKKNIKVSDKITVFSPSEFDNYSIYK